MIEFVGIWTSRAARLWTERRGWWNMNVFYALPILYEENMCLIPSKQANPCNVLRVSKLQMIYIESSMIYHYLYVCFSGYTCRIILTSNGSRCVEVVSIKVGFFQFVISC